MIKLNLLEETRFEKLPVSVFENPKSASINIAHRVANIIRKKQAENTFAVLGLATGVTPIAVYNELVRLHKEEDLSFKNGSDSHCDCFRGNKTFSTKIFCSISSGKIVQCDKTSS